MTTHSLKILPAYFADIYHGVKTFEIRKDDRGYNAGDTLVLSEWDQFKQAYTGRYLWCHVPYIIRDPEWCKEGYCVMSIRVDSGYGPADGVAP